MFSKSITRKTSWQFSKTNTRVQAQCDLCLAAIHPNYIKTYVPDHGRSSRWHPVVQEVSQCKRTTEREHTTRPVRRNLQTAWRSKSSGAPTYKREKSVTKSIAIARYSQFSIQWSLHCRRWRGKPVLFYGSKHAVHVMSNNKVVQIQENRNDDRIQNVTKCKVRIVSLMCLTLMWFVLLAFVWLGQETVFQLLNLQCRLWSCV